MRNLAPVFIITVGALFVLFMVISDSNVLEALGGRTNDVGSVNGIDISYQEFQLAVERQRESQKQQTGNDVPEEQFDQFRDQVWETLVTEKLIEQEVQRLGITVSNQEIKDIILGDDPPAFLKQNFIDSLGRFNREMYEEAIFNPQNEQILLQAEEIVKQTRYREKLQSLLEAGITISEDEIMRKFIEQNTYMDAQYALFANALFPDSVLNITEKDLRNYYDANPDKFKVNAQRKLSFVLFRNEPSNADSMLVIKNLENVKRMAENDTSDFKYFVDIYSEVPYSVDTFTVSELSNEAIEAFKEAQKGSIVGPVPSTRGGYDLYHLLNIIPTSEKSVKASHILVSQMGDDAANLAEANRIYDELKNGADFAQAAQTYSKDPGSAKMGGNLGWFGKGMMVKEFEEACFSGKVGEIQKPVKTSFGYHIILVTNQSTSKYVVEKINNAIQESATSRDAKFTAANDFSFLTKKNGFEKEAELMGYSIQQSGSFTLKSTSIPGLGANKRLISFAFENSLNSISEVHKLPGGYVVAKITEVIPDGLEKFEDNQPKVRQLLVVEKQYEKARELAIEVMKKAGNDLNKVNQIDSRIQVGKTGRFNSTTSIPTIGKDNAFIFTALTMKPGDISEPVRGLRGYFIFQLTEKTPFDSTAYQAQAGTLRSNLIQEKKTASLNAWLAEIKEQAEIVDNRHMFYGY
ncbi:MAG: peptidylprolyl isomerase [Ignavibacteriaceae bacterium]|nr:peptidylprolyl isomerase [Ignavibacteriaceae bacterium]